MSFAQVSDSPLSAERVAEYLLYLDTQSPDSDGISHLKLQKLLYYAQGYYYATYQTPLFAEAIEAWQHGPVVESIYQRYKSYQKAALPAPEHFDSQSLSLPQRQILQQVYQQYGQYSAWALRQKTHQESPWKEARSQGFNTDISHEALASHFKHLVFSDENISFLEAQIPERATEAFSQAYWKALNTGHSVLEYHEGSLVRIAPDGTKEVIEQLPTQERIEPGTVISL